MSRVNPPAAGSVAKITRRERAKATRRRIAEAALVRFSGQGYAATTMDAIAGDAGVAVQTVYFTFHTKAELLIAALKIAGGGPGATRRRPRSRLDGGGCRCAEWAASARIDRRARQRDLSTGWTIAARRPFSSERRSGRGPRLAGPRSTGGATACVGSWTRRSRDASSCGPGWIRRLRSTCCSASIGPRSTSPSRSSAAGPSNASRRGSS